VALSPGSILLVFTAPGRAPVRLPLLLERGEEVRLKVDFPPAADVPAGFVHVPPGRFLYGSSGDEGVRKTFFGGPPQHPVETGAYLIAENETTYAEWIAFLSALPREERRARTPAAKDQGFVVALTELPDGDYQITLGPEADPHVARTGEPIRYRGRTLRAEQRWLRLPVTGVTFEDMLAYAAWLDRSGRVPGARLCDEREWERAARGADDRAFPGGDQMDPDDANHDVTYGRNEQAFGPDEVGSHRASDSPFGVHDMAGNVWELTSSADDPSAPVARGGSFYQRNLDSASVNRAPFVPKHGAAFVGFRICATRKLP
jgi:formylglycine-generating enzyme required for sulfatase activity